MWQEAKNSPGENGCKNGYTLLIEHKTNEGNKESSNTHNTCSQPIHPVDPVDRIHHTGYPEPG